MSANQPNVQELPPEEAPKQITVRYVSRTLGDHFAGFLAANNLSGYLADPDYVLRDDRVGDILLATSVKPGMRIEDIKQQASDLKRLTEKQLGHSKCLELLARALGYPTYYLASVCRDADGYVHNVWAGEGKGREILYDQSGVIKGNNSRRVFRNNLIVVLYAMNRDRNVEHSQQKKASKGKGKNRNVKRYENEQ